jgi:Tfp pilus assembly protein PilV
VLLVVALLGFGLLALLLLNTASAQDAFRLSDQQRQSKALADQEQLLTRQASALSDPASVAAAASKLGMVPGAVPIFLAPGQKAPAGEIIGGMVIVSAPPAPAAPKPTTHAAATTPTTTPATKASPTKPATAATAATKPATTAKPPTAASVQQAMRNFAAFQRYANWRKLHPGQTTGTTSTGSHP